MIGTLFKWTVFISSYIPVFMMIFLNNLNGFNKSDFIQLWNKNPSFWWGLIILSVISFLCLCIWLLLLKKESVSKNNPKYDVISYDPNDSDILNFFITFIIPILSLKVNSNPSILMNGLLIVIEGIFLVRKNSLYYNVLLIFMGYHIYTFNNNSIIITKKKIDDLLLHDTKASQVGTTNIFYI